MFNDCQWLYLSQTKYTDSEQREFYTWCALHLATDCYDKVDLNRMVKPRPSEYYPVAVPGYPG